MGCEGLGKGEKKVKRMGSRDRAARRTLERHGMSAYYASLSSYWEPAVAVETDARRYVNMAFMPLVSLLEICGTQIVFY